MKRITLFIGLFLTAFALAGCSTNNVATPVASPAPTPTIHPFFGDSAIEQNPIPTTITNTTNIPIEDNIHDIDVILNDGNAIITWISDIPTIGSVAYGTTQQYEMGEMRDEIPLSQHAVTLTNLDAETTYYYRIITADAETDAIIDEYDNSFDTLRQVPIIDVWYGIDQTFGQSGTPQRWINILGNVSDPDGVLSLTYSLNGEEEQPLSMGPDQRRLAESGDFNVDIARTTLSTGENELMLRATDTFDNQEIITVTITYTEENIWLELTVIDWQAETDIQEAAEIIDGLWTVSDGEIRTEIPGYDRFIAIGDIAWTDYEVTVPITIHDVHFAGGDDNAPGIGLLARWTGHTDVPLSSWQPKSGWQPYGAIAWYHWDTPDLVFLRLEGDSNSIAESVATEPQQDVRYNYKLRVETLEDGETLYRFKVWLDDQSEPEAWDLSNEMVGPPNGSVLLLAHHVDASFGEVRITALAPPTLTPALPNISGGNYYTITIPITGTLPITGTAPITGTLPITGTAPLTETSSIPLFMTKQRGFVRGEYVGLTAVNHTPTALPNRSVILYTHHA